MCSLLLNSSSSLKKSTIWTSSLISTTIWSTTGLFKWSIQSSMCYMTMRDALILSSLLRLMSFIRSEQTGRGKTLALTSWALLMLTSCLFQRQLPTGPLTQRRPVVVKQVAQRVGSMFRSSNCMSTFKHRKHRLCSRESASTTYSSKSAHLSETMEPQRTGYSLRWAVIHSQLVASQTRATIACRNKSSWQRLSCKDEHPIMNWPEKAGRWDILR